MKREDVIQLAREHGTGGWQTLDAMVRFGERVAEKAVAEERERCASLIEGRAVYQPGPKIVTLEFNQAAQVIRSGLTWVAWLNNLSGRCAAAIRARKDNT